MIAILFFVYVVALVTILIGLRKLSLVIIGLNLFYTVYIVLDFVRINGLGGA